MCNNKYQLSFENTEDLQRLNSFSGLLRVYLLKLLLTGKQDNYISTGVQVRHRIKTASTQCNVTLRSAQDPGFFHSEPGSLPFSSIL